MTFADKLEELRKAATTTPYLRDQEEIGWFLANNADAILELVRAAEEVAKPSGYRDYIVAHNELRQALAKLNKEQQIQLGHA